MNSRTTLDGGRSTSREVTLDLVVRIVTDDDETRVEGVISSPDSGARTFVGWMALLDSLEELVEDSASGGTG